MNEGLGIVPWGAQGGGFLSGKYRRDERPAEGRLAMMPDDTEEAWDRRNVPNNWRILDVMDDIITSYDGLTHSQVALAWLLAQPAVDSVLIGVRTEAQLEDNLKAAEVQLSSDELIRLDEVSVLQERYPYRFLKMYAAR
jgi:aryl-alcohol dehydrogenase (NADP+)